MGMCKSEKFRKVTTVNTTIVIQTVTFGVIVEFTHGRNHNKYCLNVALLF